MADTELHKLWCTGFIACRYIMSNVFVRPCVVNLCFAVWHIGIVLVLINAVALRRARLVLGWVTVHGFESRLAASWYLINQTS